MFKKIAKVFFVILGILLLLYIAGVVVFSTVFMPNTTINGKDFSLVPMADLYSEYDKSWEDYDLVIKGRNGRKDRVLAKDFSYVEKLKKGQKIEQRAYYWPFYSLINKEYKLKADVNMDRAKFDQVLAQLHVVADKDIKDPNPAHIGYEQGKGYVVVPADPGDRVEVNKLKKAILAKFSQQKQVLDLEEEALYLEVPPTENKKQMENHVKSLNDLEGYALSFNFSDRIEPLAGEVLINLHSQDQDGFLQPDKAKVDQYVKDLAAKFDTFRGTREFAITGGGTVRIPGGIYGWKTDQEKTSALIMEALAAKETKELTPIYSREAMSRNVNDIGASYIEIDIARQHMWLYKDGNLVVESPVVTGDPTSGNGTPTGTGVVWSMETGRYLTGDTWKSWVNYWMPFNWSGCGIHDSNWRSSYGGSIYRGGGSHGCVNTPPGKAKIFYQNSFKGMPVVVYNSYSQRI